MRRIILLYVLCFLSIFTMAQESKELKQIKLKTGLTISGYITTGADGSINVTTTNGDQLWYQANEVASVTDDPSVAEARKKAEAKAKEEEELRMAKEKEDAKAAKRAEKESIKMKEKGFQLIAESMFCSGKNFIFSIAPCYRVNKHFVAGLGFGFNQHNYWATRGSDGSGFSSFLKVMYNFKSKRATPYLGFNAGYCFLKDFNITSFGTINDVDSYFAVADLGWLFRTRRGGGLNFALSLIYLPAPSSIHGIKIEDTFSVGGKIGWTF